MYRVETNTKFLYFFMTKKQKQTEKLNNSSFF